jgi:hypothetical protein
MDLTLNKNPMLTCWCYMLIMYLLPPLKNRIYYSTKQDAYILSKAKHHKVWLFFKKIFTIFLKQGKRFAFSIN